MNTGSTVHSPQLGDASGTSYLIFFALGIQSTLKRKMKAGLQAQEYVSLQHKYYID